MINAAEHYLSPDLNKAFRASHPEWSKHNQPRDAMLAIEKVRQLPRRAKPGDQGYDAFSIAVIEMQNDGSGVSLVEGSPSPSPNDIYHYNTMIARLSAMYATRFKDLS